MTNVSVPLDMLEELVRFFHSQGKIKYERPQGGYYWACQCGDVMDGHLNAREAHIQFMLSEAKRGNIG